MGGEYHNQNTELKDPGYDLPDLDERKYQWLAHFGSFSLSEGYHLICHVLIALIISYAIGYLGWSWIWSVLFIGLWIGISFRQLERRQRALRIHLAKAFHSKNKLIQVLEVLPTWLSFSRTEQAAWLNHIVSNLWPTMQDAVNDTLRASLSPVFDASCPNVLSSLRFGESLGVGDEPPKITGVTVHSQFTNEVRLDISFKFYSNGLIDIEAISGPLTVTATVEKLSLVGTFRVSLRPFIGEMPGFSCLSVAFAGAPEIDFEMELDDMSIPGLDGILHDFANSAVQTYFVWPVKVVVPMIPNVSDEVFEKLNTASPCGALRVTIFEAKGFPVQGNASCSTFVTAETSSSDNNKFSTDVCKRAANPTWTKKNQHIFPIFDTSTEYLQIKLHIETTIKTKEIGTASVPLCTLEDHPIMQQEAIWLPLSSGGMILVHAQLMTSQPTEITSISPEELDDADSWLLTVDVVRALDLENRDLKTESDPFCILSCGTEADKKTSVKPNTCNPEWNESFNFVVEDKKASLLIDIRDNDTFSSDSLGHVEIPMVRMLYQQVQQGSISAEQTFMLEKARHGKLVIRTNIVPFDLVASDSEEFSHSTSALSDDEMPLY